MTPLCPSAWWRAQNSDETTIYTTLNCKWKTNFRIYIYPFQKKTVNFELRRLIPAFSSPILRNENLKNGCSRQHPLTAPEPSNLRHRVLCTEHIAPSLLCPSNNKYTFVVTQRNESSIEIIQGFPNRCREYLSETGRISTKRAELNAMFLHFNT